jgi:hypothetical protein
LSYSDPLWIGTRHDLPSSEDAQLKAMAEGLQEIATLAAAP